MNLVIVESPTKAKTLRKFLGTEYAIEASMGHIRDLPKSSMGVDVDHNFTPEYVKTEGKTPVITKLKKLSKEASKIFLATDPDREGEAISWHIQSILEEAAKTKKEKDALKEKFVRATFHEITKDAIHHAIENPQTLNMDLVNAQQARRILDRLVGYYLSPVLWKKVRRGLSAGRVQSVALRLIVEREKERLAFVPEEYWEVLVDVSDDLTRTSTAPGVVILATDTTEDGKAKKKQEQEAGTFRLQVIKHNGKDYTPTTRAVVEPLLTDLPTASYTVSDIQSSKRVRSAYAPFTTSTLQQAAANKLGFTSKRTMKLAQDLYEQGLITYHRTDSVNLSVQAVTAARDYIGQTYGERYLPEKPRLYQTKSKNAQEAHEAIRPTTATTAFITMGGKLDESHVKLYDLIWRRFMATQMADAIYNQTALLVDAVGTESYTLKANGSVLVFDGWTKLFPGSEDVILPELSVGQKLSYQTLQALQKFTQPPARYNDASLVKALEKLGIGRPSTYASIISVIEARGYVEREQKAFVPTPVGTTVSDFLVENFPQEVDFGFTASMEDDLDAISRGEKEWVKVMKHFFAPFEKQVVSVTKEAVRAQVPVEEFGQACPKCQEGKLVIRTGRFGKFISCNRYPECDFTGKLIYRVANMTCPECSQGEIRQRSSKGGRIFFGCSRYPSCKYSTWNKPGTNEENPIEMTYIANEPRPKTDETPAADKKTTKNAAAKKTTTRARKTSVEKK